MSTKNLPPILYIGHEKLKRVRITPLPPKNVVYERHGEYHQWIQGGCDQCPFSVCPSLGIYDYGSPMDCGFELPAEVQPYSVRSFLIQLSLLNDFPCRYFIKSAYRDDFGNLCWTDGCMESCGGTDYQVYIHPCNVVNGWMNSESRCPGWKYIENLCQTQDEKRFLYLYLRLKHEREFPMALPQVYVDALEQVRPDFVVFVPGSTIESAWKWLAIEIERVHLRSPNEEAKRTSIIESSGYEIVRIPAENKMLDEVRKLYKRIAELQSRPEEKVPDWF